MREIGDLTITSASTERQKRSLNLAPVLVINSGNSLVFSRKIIASPGSCRCCAPGASAPVLAQKLQLYAKKAPKHNCTILFKITTRMKLLFWNYFGDYSYSFQGSSEKNWHYSYSFLAFLAECSYRKEFPSGILKNFRQLQLHDLMVFESKM